MAIPMRECDAFTVSTCPDDEIVGRLPDSSGPERRGKDSRGDLIQRFQRFGRELARLCKQAQRPERPRHRDSPDTRQPLEQRASFHAVHYSEEMEGILSAWGRILTGYTPALSIEITREVPMRCRG